MNEDCPRCQSLARGIADRLDMLDELANGRLQTRKLAAALRGKTKRFPSDSPHIEAFSQAADALDDILAGRTFTLPDAP
jgi:hypothetical protein